jgi:hypothetical protein
MKYIVVKACIGFGDRLQSLMMYVKYAIDHKLQIYVDWSDEIWSHGSENFYTYFKLINIPVLNSLDDIPEDAVVYPSYWKGKIKDTLSMELSYNKELNVGIINENKVFPCDVLVVISNGNRKLYNIPDFFANVFRVIDPRIIHGVISRQNEYNLSGKVAVHLRGTDRAVALDKIKRLKGIGVRMVSAGMMGGAKFIAVSDDVEFIKLWKEKYPTYPVLSKIVFEGSKGNHIQKKDELTISKDELNVDMLIDFFSIASCISIISTMEDSRFTNAAMTLRRFVPLILSG